MLRAQEIPPRWDLSDLYSSPQDPALKESLQRIGTDAAAFAERYRGGLAKLTPTECRDALAAYERIQQESSKPGSYAGLLFAADTTPEIGAFYQRVREELTAATLPLIFFEIELGKLGAERLGTLAENPELAPFHHYLQAVSRRARYQLSEQEERVLEETANTGRRAFVRLYEEIGSHQRFDVPGFDRRLNLSETLDLQQSPDRNIRRASAEALTEGVERDGRTVAYIFNTLIQDKATENRLRGYSYPEQARHLSNELTPEIVETVVQSVEAGYPLVERYYRAKRQVLGLSELFHYDRYAPLAQDGEPIDYTTAKDTILQAFRGFDNTYADSGEAFFRNGWIDAEARAGKRGGAFCAACTPDSHPYLFVNYLGKSGDVRTLAHELGHGIHYVLARQQNFLNFYSTLPMAEVASTFAEMIVFEARAIKLTPDQRLAAFGEQIEQSIATVFRQTALYRFEQAIHRARQESGELTVEQFGALWQREIGRMFGDSITLGPGHSNWWMYIRHFIASPFYVYAYSFGEMLALALYQRYRDEGAPFVPRYREMLAMGGSHSPQELVAPLGVRLDDPAFWQGAIQLLETEITAFEKLAASVR